MIGEEVGFIGAVVVALLFLIFFLRGISIARKANEPFHYYLAYGLSMMIAIQAIFNFAVVTGLLPTKGLPLPFISYGGSSLIINMTAVGLLLNISKNKRHGVEMQDIITPRHRSDSDSVTVYAPGRSRLKPATSRSQWHRGYGYSTYNRQANKRRRSFGLR